jgi:cytidylate kinase
MEDVSVGSGALVLAISRQLGSGGSFIGQAVASRFGMHYADRDVLHEAALALGVTNAAIESLEERVETFWDRAAHMFARGGAEGPYTPLMLPLIDTPGVIETETRIIRELASRENAVVVGRGAAHVLRDHPNLISIFVHAPEAFRTDRIVATRRLTASDATALIRRSDADRSAFVKALRGTTWATATLYDLTVDTSTVGLEPATDIVAGIVERRLRTPIAHR